jgi:hypothetical protein
MNRSLLFETRFVMVHSGDKCVPKKNLGLVFVADDITREHFQKSNAYSFSTKIFLGSVAQSLWGGC